MRIARRHVVRRRAAPPCAPPANAIVGARKAGSIIAITSASIAPA
jgi:hypothetical protein